MGYGSSCCHLKKMVMKVTLPRAQIAPQYSYDPEHVCHTRQQWGVPGCQRAHWKSTPAMREPWPKSPLQADVRSHSRTLSHKALSFASWVEVSIPCSLTAMNVSKMNTVKRFWLFFLVQWLLTSLCISLGDADFIPVVMIHPFSIHLFVLICSQLFCSDLCRYVFFGVSMTDTT